MKLLTQEWIAKAEADYLGAMDLRRARRPSNRELICYHLHQCAEKLLKARLCEAGISFPKTHDLVLLLGLTTSVEPLWASFSQPLGTLSAFAIEIRYPGTSAQLQDVREAIRVVQSLRKAASASLGFITREPGKRKRTG